MTKPSLLPQQSLQKLWTTENGKRIFARVSLQPDNPQNPPIVMVHAVGTSSRYMEPLARRLAPYGDVYALDQPGFGHSEKHDKTLTLPQLAENLAGWMNTNKIDQAVMIANSTGCSIVADFAVRYPEKLLGAVMIGPAVDPHARTWPQEAWRYVLTAFHEAPSLFVKLTLDYINAGLVRVLRSVQFAFDEHIELRLPQMTMPTLIARGSEDAFAPQPWVEEAVRLLPHGELVTIPGAGHILNYSEPDKLTLIILDWLSVHDLTMPIETTAIETIHTPE